MCKHISKLMCQNSFPQSYVCQHCVALKLANVPPFYVLLANVPPLGPKSADVHPLKSGGS